MSMGGSAIGHLHVSRSGDNAEPESAPECRAKTVLAQPSEPATPTHAGLDSSPSRLWPATRDAYPRGLSVRRS